ncbi:arginine/serine-rich protein PNISR isoform X2 [Ctenocephalides felis]|uniref:arginine/serine-rich protein PNISR isoform X2 n=1 Tax=Ctenocephalides felis TaxID=7515 RepID=UPI000E6E1A4A|nr:arginine/serine-rich protein PNISR isoform X2 [Ctenocephalides felis]
MYTGQNSLRHPTKWALNASAYDNVSADQVDWAALAQQWIQMKETSPAESSMPLTAPPPPNITPINIRPPPAPAWNSTAWNYPGGVSQPAWPPAAAGNNWNWNNSVNITAPPPPIISNIESIPKEEPALPNSTFSTFPPSIPPAYPAVQPLKEYWTIPEQSTKEKSSYKEEYVQPQQGFPDAGITLDAAKRKQLPAWIRQGLEKMEREKQKQMEKEQDLEQRRIMLEQKRLAEEQAFKELQQENSTGVIRSKFDSDTDEEDINGKSTHDEEQEVPKYKKVTKVEPPPIISQFRTKEERLQDVMLCVRQTLTEILLDVTNDEILAISRDTINRFKNSAQTLRKTNALTSITGGLGLGIYGESSGSESDNSDNDDSPDGSKDNNKDSDLELERAIRQKRSEFEKTSREIEAKLQAEEDGMKKTRASTSRELKESDRNAEPEIKSGRGDGEKYYRNPDDAKSSVSNTHQNTLNRNKSDVPKIEQNVQVEKKSESRKKSRSEKSQSSRSSSESDIDSDTDSDSNSSRTRTSETSESSNHSSREKRTNLCRKKSQKSASPERNRRSSTKKSSKSRDKRVSDKDYDIMSMKESKDYAKMKKNEKAKRSVRDSRSLSYDRRSRSRESSRYKPVKERSRSRDRKHDRDHRSRSVESSYSRGRARSSRSSLRRHRSRSRDTHRHRSRSRSYSRDRKRRSRSRDRDRDSSYKRHRSRSRSRSSRRSRSRSRGKRSHRR